jgi:DNA-directed RNA polymerase sigma subunit (sigma70/sigma32)
MPPPRRSSSARWRDELFSEAREHPRRAQLVRAVAALRPGGRTELTLDALGRELGISRESVRKIETLALARLQSVLAAA